jgi:hypothetical protein
MLVFFRSSEAGEVLMMSDAARPLLKAMGKRCTARGVIVKSEIPLLVETLTRFLQEQPDLRKKEKKPAEIEDERDDLDEREARPEPVSLRQRAWPLIQMLNRTAQARKEGQVIWEAAADFEAEEGG